MTEGHLKAIGRICVNFSYLELMIAFRIWSFINSDQNIGKMVTSGMSFAKLLDLLNSLIEYKIDDERKKEDMISIIKKASEIEGIRNQVIHSAWTSNDDTGKVGRIKITVKRNKGLQIQEEELDDKDLNGVADKIKAIAEDFKKYLED
jgi:hypothetical protein